MREIEWEREHKEDRGGVRAQVKERERENTSEREERVHRSENTSER